MYKMQRGNLGTVVCKDWAKLTDLLGLSHYNYIHIFPQTNLFGFKIIYNQKSKYDIFWKFN